MDPMVDVIKQEVSQSGNLYHHHHHGHDHEFQVSGAPWSHMVPVSSSPRSSVASFSSDNNNLLDFTYNKTDHRKNQLTSEVIIKTHLLIIPSFITFPIPTLI